MTLYHIQTHIVPRMLVLVVVSFVLFPAGADPDDEALDSLRLNQIQVVGTHNSYHVSVVTEWTKAAQGVTEEAFTWDYTHAPLDVQLERGVRSLEIDVYHDPAGTRVMHVPLYDEGTTCNSFTGCLGLVRDWSLQHPSHVPIIILVELKDEPIPLAKVLPFDEKALNQLDDEIRSVIAPKQLLTPDLVRGESTTLAGAIREHGWPQVKSVRGKIMLVLHARGQHAVYYTKDRPSLEGRAMFLESQPDAPYAAFFIENNPLDHTVTELVSKGYMVRTRADVSKIMIAAGKGERQREAALAGGAQVVTTDYPVGEPEPTQHYIVALPNNVPVRPNPITAPGISVGQ